MGQHSRSISPSSTGLIVRRRGKSGGQVRDEYREEYDPGRGGYGKALAKAEEDYGKGK